MRFPRCSCSKQWGDGQLNWQTKHMIGFGMGGNHQLVLSFGLLRVSKSGVYTRKQGFPPIHRRISEMLMDFGMTYWIHVAGGQGTPLDSIDGHPWQKRFSSMKEECSSWSFHVFWIFQPIFAGLTQLKPINTLFVRSWCTMRTLISLISTFVGQIRSARAATAGVVTRF